MKAWLQEKRIALIKAIVGRLGVPITAVISGAVGATVAKVYAWLGGIEILSEIGGHISDQMTPEQLAVFEPRAVGAVVGVAAFAYIQQRINSMFLTNAKKTQEAINGGLLTYEQIPEDGLPLNVTQHAADIVAKRSIAAAKSANPKLR